MSLSIKKKFHEFVLDLESELPSRSAVVKRDIQSTFNVIGYYIKHQHMHDDLEEISKFISKNHPHQMDDDSLLDFLHEARAMMTAKVRPMSKDIPEINSLLPDQKAILDILLEHPWRGPCSVHVLYREEAGEKSMVILFGEFHPGSVDLGAQGIIEFFKRVTHFPTEIFIEKGLVPGDIKLWSTATHPLVKNSGAACKKRIHVLAEELYDIRRYDKLQGHKNRFHFIDTRQMHTNKSDIHAEINLLLSGTDMNHDTVCGMSSAWETKLKSELSKLSKGNDLDFLKGAAKYILDKTEQACVQRIDEDAYVSEHHHAIFNAALHWVDIYAVCRLIRKLKRYHTAIVYAGEAHIQYNHRTNSHQFKDSKKYAILPLLKSLNFHVIYAVNGCYREQSSSLEKNEKQSSSSYHPQQQDQHHHSQPWILGEGEGGGSHHLSLPSPSKGDGNHQNQKEERDLHLVLPKKSSREHRYRSASAPRHIRRYDPYSR